MSSLGHGKEVYPLLNQFLGVAEGSLAPNGTNRYLPVVHAPRLVGEPIAHVLAGVGQVAKHVHHCCQLTMIDRSICLGLPSAGADESRRRRQAFHTAAVAMRTCNQPARELLVERTDRGEPAFELVTGATEQIQNDHGEGHWCPEPESNRYGLRRGILSPLCLPISPSGHNTWELGEPLEARAGIEPT